MTTRALVLVAVAGCSMGHADPTPDKRFEEDMMLRFHMHENFGLAHELERDLIRGRLDEAKALAAGFAQAPDESGYGAWAASAAKVRERAAAIAKAKTLDEALRADAGLLAACATCHVATGARPEFLKWPAAPVDRDTVDARMLRHLWATDRLWEGMIGDADESWRAGLDVLAQAPLTALPAERAPFAAKLQRAATDAKRRPTPLDLASRTTVYGDILVTCAACHTAKPKP